MASPIRPGAGPCPAWASRVSAFFDGEASELDAGEVRAHLLACPACRAALSTWGSLREDLALLQPVGESHSASAGASAGMEATLDRVAAALHRGVAGELRVLDRSLRLWTAAAATLLVVGLGLLAARELRPLSSPVRASAPRDIDRAVREILARPIAPSRPAKEVDRGGE